MNTIEIRGGRVIDPANQIDAIGSVYIAGGKVVGIFTKPLDFNPTQIIHADNLMVSPGFVDLSVRLREPGYSHKATFASETVAAASAGVTSLCLPPDTQPTIDTPAVAELIRDKAEKAHYEQIYPIGALTQRLAGNELSAMFALKEAGCIAVSNAQFPLRHLAILRRAMEYATSHNLLLIYRPDEASLSHQGCVHEGFFSTHYGLPGIPEAAESIAVAQCLDLAELTGCRVHFAQISSKRSVIKIQQAKKYGLNVSADVAVHQLHFSDQNIEAFNSAYHVLPPFRTETDRKYLLEGLMNGTIDAICSDHQPHDIDAKLGAFPETEAGVASLETLLPLTLNLVETQVLSLSQAMARLTQKPAEVLGLKAGTLSLGHTADICIFDPEAVWQVNRNTWKSAGINTPFWGKSLKGQVIYTLQGGRIIYTIPRLKYNI
jgi:dihydroorotase